ncbi:GTP-binding protein 1 [Psilocybe cubensis]|uniref:GTP-binding protein 1 n=1 Tax=Psilocybe cubensis TaxID=181762 RepID=A0ACB8HC84_PSICU|nr:GTP-binding protein 1 [Psilocybe cubensis]KAH9485398.1 GTP-binding protein 1 [Psilocybe cubensis]
MTTLRTFQNEIEDIHHREISKQRAQALMNKEKETKQKGKGKEDQDAVSVEAENLHGAETAGANLQELEERILTLLLSSSTPDYDSARDLLAALLTQCNGEHVLRIGQQPSHTALFSGELKDESAHWSGTPRTIEEIGSLRTQVTKAVEEVGGKASVLFETITGHARISLLLRLPPPNVSLTPEVRCAVVGNVDSGKSTTLGVLTRGALDDGRGRARVGLFRHKHEIETGRTSSVGMEILGFNSSGVPILPNTSHLSDPDAIRREKMGWEEISVQAAKIVSFIDLAGHERYLKTTLYGLTSGAPSCVILMVGANAGLIGMSKEHLAIALALSVPVVVCITKIDMTPPNVLAETIKQVAKILQSPGCRKNPVFVKSVEASVEIATSFNGSERLCPIFQISNVTGQGLDFVRTFLNLLPSSERDTEKFAVNQPLEYSITEVWSVPYVGTVVNGIINAGSVKTGDSVLLGPDSNGHYQTSVIKSMQRKRADVTRAEAGQCVSLALKRIRRAAVRKGMVLVAKTETPPRAIRQFEGQVLILYHNTTLQKNYQAIRQTVRIIGMDHPQGVLRTGDRATVQFEFISHPEFVKEGMKLLFREGKTKFTFSPDPRQWGLPLALDLIESDDDQYISLRERDGFVKGVSARGIGNVGCLLLLIAGLLALFIGYPVVTFYIPPILDTSISINSTGQVPQMMGNQGLIDTDTPREAYTRNAWNDATTEMKLVFSDEFNVDGRSFYPGDDPYWEAVDLHYWYQATNNLEWYDPEAITTKEGSLVITLSQKRTHGMDYEGGMLTTWNKFCFTGGYVEASVQLPGASNVLGLWPAIWAMGNLGRAGYGASLEGLWMDDLLQQRLTETQGKATLYLIFQANDYPDALALAKVIQAQSIPMEPLLVVLPLRLIFSKPKLPKNPKVTADTLVGQVSQSAQWAPFDAGYLWNNSPANMVITNPNITQLNTFIGSATQQATSLTTNTNSSCYELPYGACYAVYGFEYITWVSDNKTSWTLNAPGMGPDPNVQISARPVAKEPMYLIANLGMSRNFGPVDLDHLTFPAHMKIDYIRVYQPKNAINIGCDPKGFPTNKYIEM